MTGGGLQVPLVVEVRPREARHGGESGKGIEDWPFPPGGPLPIGFSVIPSRASRPGVPSEYKGAHCYSQEYVFINSTCAVRGVAGVDTHVGFACKETTTATEVRTQPEAPSQPLGRSPPAAHA